jgi:hypothetical protein
MMKSQLTAILCGLFVTGLAQASCPSNMGETEMMKCQEVEKNGANYQEWVKSHEMAKQSTISPITGKDIKKMAPAAGKPMTDFKGVK